VHIYALRVLVALLGVVDLERAGDFALVVRPRPVFAFAALVSFFDAAFVVFFGVVVVALVAEAAAAAFFFGVVVVVLAVEAAAAAFFFGVVVVVVCFFTLGVEAAAAVFFVLDALAGVAALLVFDADLLLDTDFSSLEVRVVVDLDFLSSPTNSSPLSFFGLFGDLHTPSIPP